MDLKKLVLLLVGQDEIDCEHLQHAILLKKFSMALENNQPVKEHLETLERSLKEHFIHEQDILMQSNILPTELDAHYEAHRVLLNNFYRITNFYERDKDIDNTIDIEALFNEMLNHINKYDAMHKVYMDSSNL